MTTLTNLAPAPSAWSLGTGCSLDSSNAYVSDYAIAYTATTSTALCTSGTITTPVLNHIYYGCYWYYAPNGIPTSSDNRYEVFGGDGTGKNWVIARNGISQSSWGRRSAYWTVSAVNASSYYMRCFCVGVSNAFWVDGFMLIDLTDCFGSGSEPDQTWCDTHIGFFTGSVDLTEFVPDGLEDVSETSVSSIGMTPNPVEASASILVSVGITTTTASVRTLAADRWEGSGPYTQTIPAAVDDESILYTDHTATLDQRSAEYAGVIIASPGGTNEIEVRALGIKPTVDIPVRVIGGGFPHAQMATVSSSSWSGSGPWTATVALSEAAEVALVGAISGTSDDSADAIASCGIHVSAVSGATVTLRALWAEPSIAVTLGVAYL